MGASPVESERAAPVVDGEGDFRGGGGGEDGVEEGREVAEVVGEAVGKGGHFIRGAHADQVDGDAPSVWGNVRKDVAPEVGGGGVSVKEEDGLAGRRDGANIDISHAGAEDGSILLDKGECRGDFGAGHGLLYLGLSEQQEMIARK